MTMPRVNTRWKMTIHHNRHDERHQRARLEQRRLAAVDALEALQANGQRL